MRPQRTDPAPAPTARLRRAASVTAPAQRHRPCPDLFREQEALAPAVPCFWRGREVLDNKDVSHLQSPSACRKGGKESEVEAGTWAPHHRARKRGARRQDAALPTATRAAGCSRHIFLVLRYGRARGSKPSEQTASSHPFGVLFLRVSISKESAGGSRLPRGPQARGCRHPSPRLPLLRGRVQHPAPNPVRRGSFGAC